MKSQSFQNLRSLRSQLYQNLKCQSFPNLSFPRYQICLNMRFQSSQNLKCQKCPNCPSYPLLHTFLSCQSPPSLPFQLFPRT
uniref:Uncharacterized protein n=1 Tax=Rhizophora mucronata TaxID=61149 RepID=A0A2P2JLA7_RHIMU